MTNRRTFIKQAGAAGIAASIPSTLFSQQQPEQKMIWANLLHLSYNMWEDNTPPQYRDDNFKYTTCQEAEEWAHGFRPNLTFMIRRWMFC